MAERKEQHSNMKLFREIDIDNSVYVYIKLNIKMTYT